MFITSIRFITNCELFFLIISITHEQRTNRYTLLLNIIVKTLRNICNAQKLLFHTYCVPSARVLLHLCGKICISKSIFQSLIMLGQSPKTFKLILKHIYIIQSQSPQLGETKPAGKYLYIPNS